MLQNKTILQVIIYIMYYYSIMHIVNIFIYAIHDIYTVKTEN